MTSRGARRDYRKDSDKGRAARLAALSCLVVSGHRYTPTVIELIANHIAPMMPNQLGREPISAADDRMMMSVIAYTQTLIKDLKLASTP